MGLRVALGLFAAVRPCTLYPGVRSRYERADVVVSRAHGGLVHGDRVRTGRAADGRADRVHRADDRQAHPRGLRPVDQGDQRRARAAGRAVRVRAGKGERPPEGDGRPQGQHPEVLRRAVPGDRGRVAARPGVAFEDRIIDDLAMQLVQRPEAFDVLCSRTCTATSSRTCARGWSAGSASPRREPRRRRARCSRRPTGRRRVPGPEPRQPDGADALGRDAAAPPGRDGGGRPARGGGGGGDRRGSDRHVRPAADDDPDAASTTDVRDAVVGEPPLTMPGRWER